MATPVEWLNEFQVNTGTADVAGISDPQVVGLAGGNYLVAWVEPGIGGVGTTPGNDIIGKIFDVQGNVVRDSFRINIFGNADDEGDFDIAATNDGGFSMAYVKDGPGADQEFIIYERFDDNGDAVSGTGTTIVVNTVAGESYSNAKIAVNATDNSAYITYTDVNGTQTEVHGVRVDANGTILTAEFDAAQNTFNNYSRNAEAAINTNGELVTAYEEDDGGTQSIELFITNTAGVQQHNATVSSGPGFDPQVTTLTNGNIVVTWSEDNTVYYRVYNSNAGTILGETEVYTTADILNESSVKGLPDGGFVIVWDNDTDNTLEGRRFNADGSNEVTDTVFQIEPTAGTEVNPNVGVTADGRILISYEEGDNVFSSIWDTRGANVDASDYDNPTLNFVATDLVTGNTIGTTITGDSDADTLLGQSGDDSITGGSGADSITGGNGNDTIDGGLFNDTINGDGGDDLIIIAAGNDSDIVNGGSGTDTLDFSASVLGGDITYTGVTSGIYTNGHTFTSIEELRGGTASSTYTLFLGTQTVDAGAGNDIFIHGDGEFIDNLAGGAGTDTLDLSAEDTAGVNIDLRNDTWTGLGGTRTLTGIEVVEGTQADDVLRGNVGTTLNGGDGDDTIDFRSGDGFPNFDGQAGTDTADFSTFGGTDFFIDLAAGGYIFASSTPGAFDGDLLNFENYEGSGGVDNVIGSSVANVINTGDGNDTINGGGGADTIDSGAGDDFVDIGGSSSGMVVDAGSGDDTVVANNSAGETLDGGSGIDLLDTTKFNGNYTINLVTGATNFGESFVNFENVVTGNGNDSVIGTSGDNTMTGNGGDDTLNGGAGNDLLNGGDGADLLIAGTGNDTLNGEAGDDRMRGNSGLDQMFGGDGNDRMDGASGGDIMDGGDGIDTVEGEGGNDTITGGGGDDIVRGGGGFDVVSGGTGNDRVEGNSGDDTVNGNSGDDDVSGGGGNDILDGGTGNDTLNGNSGDDSIVGSTGDDSLLGSSGDDTLDGGTGKDTFIGGRGKDVMTGGADSDNFIFAFNADADQITDFEDNLDILSIDDNLYTGTLTAADIVSTFGSNIAGGVELDFGGGDVIEVFGAGVTTASIVDDILIV